MKYFFSYNCYWDDIKEDIYRSGEKVKITPSQKKLLKYLIKFNGKMVTHEALYLAMTGSEPCGEYKSSLSNQFTRKKGGEKGLLIRVPEIKVYYTMSKKQIGGGYMISVPSEKIKQDVSNNKPNRIWYDNDDFTKWSEQGDSLSEEDIVKKMCSYLHGGRCTWPIVFSNGENKPVSRSVTKTIYEDIPQGGTIVLTGAGGEGKTTTMMQMAAKLFKEGKEVYYHAPTNRYEISDLSSEKVIFIDNPNNTDEFRTFLDECVFAGSTVVLATRSNEWNIIRESLSEDTERSCKEVTMPKISEEEAKAFANCVLKNIEHINKTKEQISDIFYKDSYGFLYASMLLIIYDSNSLEDITLQIIKKIYESEKSKVCLPVLAAVVLLENAGISVTNALYKYICGMYGIPEGDPKYYLRMELCKNGAFYQTRHSTISSLFFKYLFTEGDWKDFLGASSREKLVTNLVDFYLRKFDHVTDYVKPCDDRVCATSSIVILCFNKINNNEIFTNYIFQRVLETCKIFCHAVLDRIYREVNDESWKDKMFERCYEFGLSTWNIYIMQIRRLKIIGEIQKIREIYLRITTIKDVPMGLWNDWAEFEEANERDSLIPEKPMYSAEWIYKQAMDRYPDKGFPVTQYIKYIVENEREISVQQIRELHKEACLNRESSQYDWLSWASTESRYGNIGSYDQEGSVAWIYKEALIERNIKQNSDLWHKWYLFINKYNIERYTNYEVLRKACLEGRCDSPLLWTFWAKAEEEQGNVGDYETMGSSAWIYKEALIERNIKQNSDLWYKWYLFINKYNIEGYMNYEVLRKACLEDRCDSPLLWTLWAKAEEEQGNVGDYETMGSSAWIYQEAIKKCTHISDEFFNSWYSFIKQHKDLRGYTEKEIIDIAFKKKCSTPNIWGIWAQEEEENGNIGNYETPGSAAWIYKEAIYEKSFYNESKLWSGWYKLVKKHDIAGFATTDILRTACVTYGRKGNYLWTFWANEEEERGNIGDECQEGSAIWIYNEAINNRINVFRGWGEFLLKNKNTIFSDNKIEEECNKLKELCSKNVKIAVDAWIAWAKLAESCNNIGNYNTKYSAAWIFMECFNVSCKKEILLNEWAEFAQRHPLIYDGALIDSNYVLNLESI